MLESLKSKKKVQNKRKYKKKLIKLNRTIQSAKCSQPVKESEKKI